MGRQLKLVTTRPDLVLLFDEVRRRGGLVAELWDYSEQSVVVTHTSGLTGVLLPPPELLCLDRTLHPTRGTWVTRELSSQAVFFTAGHNLQGVPSARPPGRLWRSTVLGYVAGEGEHGPVCPDPRFAAWCDGLFAWVRQWPQLQGCHYGPGAAAAYCPQVEVSWVLARSAELSYTETEGVLAGWRSDLGLPETDLRVRVADHGGYVCASIHVRVTVAAQPRPA